VPQSVLLLFPPYLLHSKTHNRNTARVPLRAAGPRSTHLT